MKFLSTTFFTKTIFKNISKSIKPQQSFRRCSCGEKSVLTVALLGEPNAGKSTFVNNIVGQKVSAVSHIAHTTRTFTNGIVSVGSTQLIFTDTPGVISFQQGRRLKMDKNHIRAPRRVAGSADILAVITDVSFRKTKDFIDETILSILHENTDIPAILIMNKVDILKRKEDLLFLAHMLTQDRQKDEWGYKPYGGYSKFTEVFMTSAKTGDGMKDVVDYLISKAKPHEWYYSPEVFSDSSVGKQISEVFREALLQLFAQEIPWQVKQELILFDYIEDKVRIHHKLTWPKKSQQRYVSTKMEELQRIVEEELENIFQCEVFITIDISQKKGLTKDDLVIY